MGAAWSHIGRCMDLRDGDVAAAIGSGESTRALLAHLATVAAPDTGVAKVLLVFARMATTACDWLDGGLRVKLTTEGVDTRVELTTDLGGGLLERALPTLVLHAPISEFTRAIERVPRMIAPLSVGARGSKHLVLTASALVRKTSAPPPPIEIAPESLFVRAPPAPRAPSQVDPPADPLPVVSAGEPSGEGVDGGLDRGWDD